MTSHLGLRGRAHLDPPRLLNTRGMQLTGHTAVAHLADQKRPVLRVLLVGSSGGHLDQLLLLEPWLQRHEVAVATFLKPDAMTRLNGWRTYALRWPTNRNFLNLIRNTAIAWRVMRRERPDVVISSGAGGAIPFFWMARLLFQAKTVFIECYDRPYNPTLTAQLVRQVTDLFVVQWPTQLPGWPRRRDLGASR